MQNENYTNTDDDEIVINIKELFDELLAHWLIIGIVTLFCGLVSLYFFKFYVSPQYESTSQLWVLSKSTSITSLADVQLGASLSHDYELVTSGRPVLDQVISNLGLSENYSSLKRKVKVVNPSNTRIIEITVSDSDPERAKWIADEIANVSAMFIAEKMNQDPPSIIQHGYSDENPVSPNVKRNTILGALAGFVVTCGIIVLFTLLNDTVKSSDDIEKKLGLKAIAQIPLEDAKDDFGNSVKKHSRSIFG